VSRRSFALLCAAILFPDVAQAACGEHSDFLVRSDSLLAPVRPVDCATVFQSPPDFTWPPQDGENTYTLTLRHPDGRAEQRSSTKNFVIWPRALRPGTYTWTVSVKGAIDEESEPRTFTVDPGATEFVVPGGEAALARARKTPRPRTWPRDASGPAAAVKAERAPGFRDLVSQVEQAMRQPLPPEPSSRSKDANYDAVVAETKRVMAAAFAWAMTHQPSHGAEGARRLMNLASWSPRGALGYRANDMASRTIAWTLALGYDWMHDYLNGFQKAAIAASIKGHAQPMFDDIGPRISRYPYDSHGNVTLTILAAIGALMAGDLPEADEWLRSQISMAIVWTSPWGWQDGGFGNGTAQMYWDTAANLLAWYVFRNAVGADIAKKEWVHNFARAMAYFIPPGTPAGNFGDGQEDRMQELWARVAKAYAAFAPSPLARWYARQMTGEDASRLELLLAPRAESGLDALPAGTPNAASFPSIGWVAMHSDLADPLRTSIYFKSSPYGSYNHSHADQNSFVINHRGKRLAIASGWYDGYRTPHWTNWYKQTRAANAITFDGGHGQGFNDRRFSGEITQFGHGASFDFAVGNAEAAYAGALTTAQRSIAYLRPNIVVVHDLLASASPRTWEWNIHAVNRMTQHASQRIAIVNDDATLCVEMVAGPPVAFSQTDQFTAPPEDRKMVNQWHGRFATTQKSLRAEFIALLRVGADCSRPSGATAARAEGGWRVTVDGRAVAIAGDRGAVK
jgi:hypothetical protein